MLTVQQISIYFFLFVGIYFEIFILFVFVTNWKVIRSHARVNYERVTYPSVTVVVPVWNEEKTVAKTVDSLLALNYPKDKLDIFVVDDGSTDNTWNIVQKYKDNPQVKLHHKENGGKHTAVNYAIERSHTELFGCLDADSTVDGDTLKKIACRFEDLETMAVTPAMKISNPTTLIQLAQSSEYIFGILIKKVMGLMGAIHVMPGPFTIFRRSLFDKIGLFRKAHHTEDMEITFRMQMHRLKIDNVHTAWVYTTGPNTIKKLYKQRLRWTYGFLQNVRDYKFLFFNRKYGNLGFLTLPAILILIFGVLFSMFFLLYRVIRFIVQKIVEWETVGFVRPHFEFSFFYISTKLHIFLALFVFLFTILLFMGALYIAEEKVRPTKAMVFYFILFPLISPFWVLKSIYNSILSKKVSWR